MVENLGPDGSFVHVVPSEEVYKRSMVGRDGEVLESTWAHALEVRERALDAAQKLDRQVGFVATQS
jgi:hypothetical protein